MTRTEAGIRELKRRLSAYLRQVKAGGTVIITDRGKPIGRIVPIAQSTEAQLEALKQAGWIAWSGEKLPPLAPVAQAKSGQTVADLLLEDRE
jgi:prevent-host-death family protein